MSKEHKAFTYNKMIEGSADALAREYDQGWRIEDIAYDDTFQRHIILSREVKEVVETPESRETIPADPLEADRKFLREAIDRNVCDGSTAMFRIEAQFGREFSQAFLRVIGTEGTNG